MAQTPSSRFKQYLRFSAVGLELGFSVILGLLVGQWLDSKFGTSPWLMLLFLIFGLVAGFRSVYRLLRESTADHSEPPDSQERP